MLKNILNLEGAQQLTSTEQKTINGGIPKCWADAIAGGCVLIPLGGVCPPETFPGGCGSARVCC